MLATAVAVPEPARLVWLVRQQPQVVQVALVSQAERSRELPMVVAVVHTERTRLQLRVLLPVAPAADLAVAEQPLLPPSLHLLLERPAPVAEAVATAANVRCPRQPREWLLVQVALEPL
jgi:hypothetical protein